MDNHCFCPENSNAHFCERTNIKCYISSPGNADGAINGDRGVKRILRMFPSERGSRTVDVYVAHLISLWYGDQLQKYCHIPKKEPSILKHLINSVSGMEIDLGVLMDSSPIYDTAKHIKKLGLQRLLPGLASEGSTTADRFMRDFTWKDASGSPKSEGMGVNMWSLLTLVSWMQCKDIHCNTRAKVAKTAMYLISKMSPAAATPGNMMLVRSFNAKTFEPEWVRVPNEGRCEHFLRPVFDSNFAITGVPSYCAPVYGKSMPEDYLGVSGVLALAQFLKCQYWEVPPKHVYSHYNLVPRRYHPIYRKTDFTYGHIYLDDDVVRVTYDDDMREDWDVDSWESLLKERDFLVLPTIWRSGALVLTRDKQGVGCLVNSGTRESILKAEGEDSELLQRGFISNFDHIKVCYHMLVEENTTCPIGPLEVLKDLIPIGTEVWIRGGTQAWEDIRDFLPDTPEFNSDAEDMRMLKARLNVPLTVDPKPGVVYLTVLQKPRDVISCQDTSYRHLTVSPWEISPVPPEDPRLRISELLV